MNQKSRLDNSLLNLISGFGYRILIMCTAFIVRTVFIKCLSADYLSVNGLYSSILSMLSLAELGFGTAMVFSMYQPLAEKDYRKLQQLMRLYRKTYFIIGTVILVLGLCLVPFLDELIKDKPNVAGLTFYYLLFLLDSVTSYWFFSYRNSVLQADQKAHVISKYNSIFTLIKSGLQIVLLVCFHSYTIYLVTQIGCTIGKNIVLAIKVKKAYPIFNKDVKEELAKEESTRIFKDVQALMLSKISHVILNSTDNVIISAFVGLKWVGLLSNYYLVSEAITGVLTQITGAIQASLGNYFVKENRESGYQLYCKIDFLNYWLYGFSTIALTTLLNPFVELWLGKEFVLKQNIIIALSINFFVAGFMNTTWTFRSTLGLFTQGKYRPLVVSTFNVALSIILSKYWGVAGVLFATSISRACVNLWYDPWMLHKKGFEKSVIPFAIKYAWRILLLLIITVGMYFIKQMVLRNGTTQIGFVGLTVLVLIIPNAILWGVFARTEEFKYFYHLFCSMINKRVRRKKNKGL